MFEKKSSVLKSPSFLENINYQQKKAVFSKNEKICVIAGPGCGKTRTLISRICRIIEEKNEEKILVLTFGKKAINEIKSRVSRLIKFNHNNLKICNIHSFCYEFLQKNYSELEFSKSKSFNICDTDLQKSIIKQILEKNEEFVDERSIFQIIKEISLKKIDDLFEINEFTKKIYIEYEKILREEDFFDFSDLLLQTFNLLNENEKIRKEYQNKFNHILVDEFQDINEIQWKIIKKLKKKNKENNLFVVGDPNQCIYGFQGSKPKIIQSFIKDENWVTYYLSINYRSTKNIVDISNNFLRKNRNNLIQNFLESTKENGENIEYRENFQISNLFNIINYLTREKKYKLSEIAIIYRSNYLSALIEKELINNEIPYEILGSYKFLQRSEIKDIIAYLRSLIKSENSSILRILMLIQGLGKKTIELIEENSLKSGLKIIDFLENEYFKSLNKSKEEKNFFSLISSNKKANSIKNFVISFSMLKKEFDKENSLNFLLLKTLENFNYFEYLKNKFGEEKLSNVKQFINILKKWEDDEYKQKPEKLKAKEQANEFLNYLFLSFSEEDKNENDSSQIMTISNVHQVKGLEFKIVLFVYLDKGIMPSILSENKDEEKRIFYVGITRAKDILYLISMNNPSFFLSCIEDIKNISIKL